MFDKYIFDTYHEQIVKTVKGFIFILKNIIYNTIFFHFLILVLKVPKGATVFT